MSKKTVALNFSIESDVPTVCSLRMVGDFAELDYENYYDYNYNDMTGEDVYETPKEFLENHETIKQAVANADGRAFLAATNPEQREAIRQLKAAKFRKIASYPGSNGTVTLWFKSKKR